MGVLEHTRETIVVHLHIQTRAGRSLDCELVIGQGLASSVHAVIEWRPPGQWELRDLASRNGTFVDDVRLPPGQWRALALGARLAFGDTSDEWRVADLGPPPAEARCLHTGERRLASDQLLNLSDDPQDWVDLVEDQPRVWLIERNGNCTPARSGQELAIADRRWRLTLPAAIPPTEPLPASPLQPAVPTSMEFRISSDLEHIELFVECDGHCHSTSRAYTRALLELARARLTDQQIPGLHADEHGWVYSDDLCSMAGYESESRLNVEVHRARRDLARLGIANAASLIQRRRGTRQLRIATDLVRIVEFAK